MLVESIAITMILVAMVVLFLRARRKDYAIATAPLLIVPLLSAISAIVNDSRFRFSNDVQAAIIVFGLAVAVAAMGILCTKLKSRKTKYVYLLLCGGFTTILAIIFIMHIYFPG